MDKKVQRLIDEHRREKEQETDGYISVVHQPKIPTMARKLVIEAAMPGWQPKAWYEERGVKNLPPTTIKEQVDCIVECVKAGAAVIHAHPRDPLTGVSAPVNPPGTLERHGELVMAITDGAYEQVDFVTAYHTWTWDTSKSRSVDYITHTKQLLDAGKAKGVGNRYVQSALIMTGGRIREAPMYTTEAAKKGVEWMLENDVKPMYSVQSYAFSHLKRSLFDSGIDKCKPYWLAIQMGKHGDDQVFSDPWSYIQVINNVSMVRQACPDAYIGIHPAGRNWLPLAVMGIMYGCEFIRVGIEDQYWLYPHRDDISLRASDTVNIIATIAKSLGREIATADEARERIGIKLTGSAKKSRPKADSKKS